MNPELPADVPDRTSFRMWMKLLRKPRGDEPDWPLLLCSMLEAEFLRQQSLGFSYAPGKEVFKDRDQHDHSKADAGSEKKHVYAFYDQCREQFGGRLTIGSDPFWLMGYEWPNQGNYRARRADLVALTTDGGLVVFECKRHDNKKDTPLTAILEGLDYLSCLTSQPNFPRIQEGFERWREKRGQEAIPADFEKVEPDRSAKHFVVVLAPTDYYNLHGVGRSLRGDGWTSLVKVGPTFGGSLGLGFAVTDFSKPEASWFVQAK